MLVKGVMVPTMGRSSEKMTERTLSAKRFSGMNQPELFSLPLIAFISSIS